MTWYGGYRPDEAWYFDAGDPSVGLFGTEWVHAACEDWDGRDPEGVDEQVLVEIVSGQTLTQYLLLTCLDCGQQKLVDYLDWVGPDGD